ncbi:GH25 family lysozyme [Aestuariivirga sp.]|uniref:GH25 family lysozyme n=1 Tax=Aestuariivirga sp. TaxID=2650926 RepID=UPI0039E5134C
MKRKLFPITVSLCCAVLALGAIAWIYGEGWIRFNYVSANLYPVQGIDISHHQGQIDWRQAAGTPNLTFAIIKESEGGDFRDSDFEKNWKEAGEAGLIRGAYHFFSFCRPGDIQARNYLGAAQLSPESFPAIIDLEFGGNCNRRLTPAELSAELTSFMNEIAKTDTRKPIFYMTPEFRDAYLQDGIANFPAHHLWIRSIFFAPPSKPCVDWAMWQYAHNGRINGISSLVDLNVFCGKKDMLPSYLGIRSGNS